MTALPKVQNENKDQALRYQVLEAIKGKSVSNPVLQRLRQAVTGKTGLAITSYDRMHSRHNRG
jgi:hypothetical protein